MRQSREEVGLTENTDIFNFFLIERTRSGLIKYLQQAKEGRLPPLVYRDFGN